MRILVESLERLYENGLNGKKPSITKEQVKERVKSGKIDKEEYRTITGEEYE